MTQPMNEGASQRQKHHYERIHDDYTDHYYDRQSMAYRDRFVYRPLFEGLALDGKCIADLACGSGQNSNELLRYFPGAQLTGFDISARACADYRQNLSRPAIETDLTKACGHKQRFDAALIVGGLHHCVADLPSALKNIADILKPGGHLMMMEPNADFLLEGARRLWYRHDSYFDAETEHALSHDRILDLAEPYFRAIDVKHLGGPGYFLVLNSLILRMPKRVKAAMAQPLMAFDAAFNQLPGRRLFPYFLARWQRRT